MRVLSFFKQAVAGLCLAGIMASCDKEQPVANNPEVNFHSSIGSLLKVSGSDGTMWDAGDAIGIFMKSAGEPLSSSTIAGNASNKKYATTGGTVVTFVPENGGISFPNSGNVDFIAYYPYQVGLNANLDWNVDVADQSSQKDLIVLYSNDATGKNAQNTNVGLGFKHVMSKFVMTVGSELGESLNGLKIEFDGVHTQSVFSIADGSLTDDPSSKGTVEALTASNGALSEAVLLPAADLTGAKIKFTLGNKVYEWEFPAGANFEGGKKYVYDFTLKEATIYLNGTGTIEAWVGVDGGNQDANFTEEIDPVEPGGRVVILNEQFGSLRSDNGTFAAAGYTGNTTFNNFNHFDFYPNPFTYTVSGTDIRVTTLVFAHFWIPATTGSYFQISGLPANMTDIALSFEMLAGTANREANILQIVCDGNTLSPTNSDMDTHVFPTNTAASLKNFEISIPDGTTTIRLENSSFGAAADATNSAWRVGNIKIEAVK